MSDISNGQEGKEQSKLDLAEEKVRKVEIIISTVLRVGVLTSLTLVVVGLIVSFVHNSGSLVNSSVREKFYISRAYHFPHTLGAMFSGLSHFDGTSIIVLGLLLLVLTPVVRVAVSIFTFLYQKDGKFMIITGYVLAVLILSFFLGKTGG